MTMVKINMRPHHPGELIREQYLVTLGMTTAALLIQLRGLRQR
jgi:plasmid maintenance system antidote protein VapI